jgi:hypothetical protein
MRGKLGLIPAQRGIRQLTSTATNTHNIPVLLPLHRHTRASAKPHDILEDADDSFCVADDIFLVADDIFGEVCNEEASGVLTEETGEIFEEVCITFSSHVSDTVT